MNWKIFVIGFCGLSAIMLSGYLLKVEGDRYRAELPKPKEEVKTDNGWQVEKIFEVDGCKVYRFYSYGAHYFTNCSGSTMTTKEVGTGPTRETIIDDVPGGK